MQPVSLHRLDEYIVVAKHLFDSILLYDEIPIMELPPCILTELLDSKEASLQKYWKDTKTNQLHSIYKILSTNLSIPGKAEVARCTRFEPCNWNISPLESFEKSDQQSDISYKEQKVDMSIGMRLIEKYQSQFGPRTGTFTKGLVVHGVPGSVKSHLIQILP